MAVSIDHDECLDAYLQVVYFETAAWRSELWTFLSFETLMVSISQGI